MKKKFLSLTLALGLVATAAIGGTLAYFTDTDQAENVFTTGDVAINLIETFDPDNAKLMPGIDIEKKVNVQNVGSEDAYVRVHIAIPSMLDSGSEDEPQYAAYNNTLHWNFTNASLADGQWNWNSDKEGANYPGNGGTWNMYQQEVEGILYNVYVATYETALTGKNDEVDTDETATDAIYKVYLDKKVTNEQMAEIVEVLGSTPKILVVAEGGQTAGFDSAYDALDTQFGVPGSYNPWASTEETPEETPAE